MLGIIIPTLAAALIIVIFSFYPYHFIQLADAHSFRTSPTFSSSSSSFQSHQPVRQQGSSDSNDLGTIKNTNVQESTQRPSLLSLQSSPVKSSMPQHHQHQPQQQQNQTPNLQHQEIIKINEIKNSNSKSDNHTFRDISLLPVKEFPEPACRFTKDPLFCSHYLWTLN
jgi:hypothetical protein